MVTGAFAHAVLKQHDPAALAKAEALLRQVPQYARDWRPTEQALPEAERGEYLFMMAGRWADDIRGDPRFDRPNWHYVTLPTKPPGQPDWLTVPPPEAANAVTAFEQNRKLVATAPDPDERAVALCWVFHLVGDIHQPLHAGGLVTRDWPRGDKGGNLCKVRAEPGGKAFNLHYFWDGLLGNSDDLRACRNRATELRLRPEFAPDKLPELLAADRFDDWARRESSPLSWEAVFRQGSLTVGLSDADAPVLPADYAARAQAVAERRAALAGHRLAAVVRGAVR